MRAEHTYDPQSWQSVTDNIKKFFGWEVLTKAQAQIILMLYIKGASAEGIIKQLEGEE